MGFYGTLGSAISTVLRRRMAGKRRHPKWGIPYEVAIEIAAGALHEERIPTPGGQRGGTEATFVPWTVSRQLRFARGMLAGLPTEEHTPKGHGEGGRTLLYIHGGGYVSCSPATHRALIARMALALDARAVAIDYRKAPEHPFPAAIDDCMAAYRGLLDSGVDAAHLIVGGDSAGGGLVLALLQQLRTDGFALPGAAILLSPWTDPTAQGGTLESNKPYDYLDPGMAVDIMADYLNGADPNSPLVNFHRADLTGLPPMQMLTGTHEVFYDQNVEFARHAWEQGVEVTHEIGQDMVHVYPLLADVSQTARDAIASMGHFVDKHVPRD